MPGVDPFELKKLSESWRSAAARIEIIHGEQQPNLVRHLVSAFERCAEEVEELVKQTETKCQPETITK